jgi:hypothetical protein
MPHKFRTLTLAIVTLRPSAPPGENTLKTRPADLAFVDTHNIRGGK